MWPLTLLSCPHLALTTTVLSSLDVASWGHSKCRGVSRIWTFLPSLWSLGSPKKGLHNQDHPPPPPPPPLDPPLLSILPPRGPLVPVLTDLSPLKSPTASADPKYSPNCVPETLVNWVRLGLYTAIWGQKGREGLLLEESITGSG